MQGWATFLYGSLARREWFVIYGHVGKVGLPSGEEGFMWIFVAANHVKLSHNVPFHVLCWSKLVRGSEHKVNGELTIQPHSIVRVRD